MISLRTRRATLLPSTLTFAVLCHAGLASAQTPAGWPFDDKDSNSASQQAPAPPPKSAVQLRLEELYRRDGRPLPDYMRQGGSQATTAQQRQQQPAQQPVPAQYQSQTQYQSPAQYHTPAQTSVQYVQPQQPQIVRPMASQSSISQQLSDYYASQGKTMPGPQSSWSGAEPPRQPMTSYSTPTPQAPAPQPGFFERLWRKDTPTTPQTSVQVSGYAPVASATPQPAPPQLAPTQSSGSVRQLAPAPLAPPVVHAQPTVRHSIQTVDLGSSAPIETLSQPSSKHPAAASQPAVASKAPQKPSSLSATQPSPSPSATVAAKAPAASTPAQPKQAMVHPSASGVATVRDDTPPFDPKTESEADKKAGPYTGLKLDTDDAVTSPNPTRVTTANVNEPAERPRQAPMPVVDADPSSKPITQPRIAAHAVAPAHPSAEDRSGTVHLEDSTPAAPQPSAPKVFVARHPATQLPRTVDDSSAEMHKIGERIGQHGMKGFCPVALREQRQLVDAVPVYSAIYQSKRYYFSSAEALARFEQAPQKYAPIAGGADVVVQANSEQTVNGTLDFAVWYKDRLFLFSSPESADAFSLNPHPYASPYLTGK